MCPKLGPFPGLLSGTVGVDAISAFSAGQNVQIGSLWAVFQAFHFTSDLDCPETTSRVIVKPPSELAVEAWILKNLNAQQQVMIS